MFQHTSIPTSSEVTLHLTLGGWQPQQKQGQNEINTSSNNNTYIRIPPQEPEIP